LRQSSGLHGTHTEALGQQKAGHVIAQRVQILESFIMFKAWYFAHLLPLATEAAGPPPLLPQGTRFRQVVADFLWQGRLRRLAFDELHSKRSEGDLGLSCL
jgi:hypothetical protein